MTELAVAVLGVFEILMIGYFLVLNSSYLLLTGIAAGSFARHMRRKPFTDDGDLFANPSTPGVSLIVPCYNEEVGIVDSVRAMLSLRYPRFEIVVVDDGSTDSTLERLRADFDLVQVHRHIPEVIPIKGIIRATFVPRGGDPLVVVTKANGKKADTINAGINAATMPLVCVVDADSILDADGLLSVARPFVEDPDRVVAAGGVVRPANGCVVEQGQVTHAAMPQSWLARIQVVEYLRSFLMGRTGWSSLDALLVVSGAFGLFRRDVVQEIGGFDTDSMGEDAELVAHMHRHLRSQRRQYRIVFASEPVCWTEVPSTLPVLARQRARWSRGLAEVLWKHKTMIGNPRYGRLGLVVMPYYLLFELLGPVFELAGLLSTAAASSLWVLGELSGNSQVIELQTLALFGLATVGYGFVLSATALAVEEFSYRRFSSWADYRAALLAIIIENLGYRQLHSWWRLQGFMSWLLRRKASWGVMTRTGYAKKPL